VVRSGRLGWAGQSASERCDSAVRKGDEMVHDERIGEAGAVEGSICFHGENGLAITFNGGKQFQSDVHGEDLLGGPFHDGGMTADLAADVVDDGIRGEGGLEGGGIKRVDGVEIVSDGSWEG